MMCFPPALRTISNSLYSSNGFDTRDGSPICVRVLYELTLFLFGRAELPSWALVSWTFGIDQTVTVSIVYHLLYLCLLGIPGSQAWDHT